MGWLNEIWVKVKPFTLAVWDDICNTYQRLKIVIIAIGAAIIYFEWQKIKDAILVSQAKKEMQNDNKEDAKLKANEDSTNKQADALVKKAQDEPNPGDDWNSK
jgi:hypothetical protein